MAVNRTDKYIFVKADEGKILVYNDNRFYCAYMPLTTDVSQIQEVDDEPQPEEE